MSEKNKDLKIFLKGLKKIGCKRSEISEVRKKMKAYNGDLYRYRSINTPRELYWRINEIKIGAYAQPKEWLNDPMDMYLTVANTDYMHFVKKMKKNKRIFLKECFEKGFTFTEIIRILYFSDNKAYNVIRNKVKKKMGASDYLVDSYFESFNESESENLEKTNNMLSLVRIVCFTDTYNNIPMWYSYASDRKGICLKYEIKEAERKNIFPVIYTNRKSDIYDELSNIKIQDSFFATNSSIKNRLLLKTNDWSYEKEWRYLKSMEEDDINEEMEVYFDKKLSKSFDKLSQEEKEEIEKLFENNTKETFNEKFRSIPKEIRDKLPIQEIIGEFFTHYKNEKGAEVKLIPSEIYLGDKICEKYEEKLLKKIANCEHIKKIYKMVLTPTGYIPVEYDEAKKNNVTNEAKKKAKKNLKKADEYMEESKYQEAIQECDESITILQKIADEYCDNSIKFLYGETYNNRGICHSKTGKFEKALVEFNEAIRINPSFPVYHYNAGNMYRKMGKCENYWAIEEYKKTISEWSTWAVAYINLTIVYIDESKYELAIEMMKKGLIKCKDFAKKLCENSEFKDITKISPEFVKMIQIDNELSKVPELKEIIDNNVNPIMNSYE